MQEHVREESINLALIEFKSRRKSKKNIRKDEFLLKSFNTNTNNVLSSVKDEGYTIHGLDLKMFLGRKFRDLYHQYDP